MAWEMCLVGVERILLALFFFFLFAFNFLGLISGCTSVWKMERFYWTMRLCDEGVRLRWYEVYGENGVMWQKSASTVWKKLSG